MLARANRITRGVDYRLAVRRGTRVVGRYTVCHIRRTGDEVTRFGFVVGKSVGIAVVRNLVRRRLKAICREALPSVPMGADFVIRALPACAQAPWDSLREEILQALITGPRRAGVIGKGGAST